MRLVTQDGAARQRADGSMVIIRQGGPGDEVQAQPSRSVDLPTPGTPLMLPKRLPVCKAAAPSATRRPGRGGRRVDLAKGVMVLIWRGSCAAAPSCTMPSSKATGPRHRLANLLPVHPGAGRNRCRGHRCP